MLLQNKMHHFNPCLKCNQNLNYAIKVIFSSSTLGASRHCHLGTFCKITPYKSRNCFQWNSTTVKHSLPITLHKFDYNHASMLCMDGWNYWSSWKCEVLQGYVYICCTVTCIYSHLELQMKQGSARYVALNWVSLLWVLIFTIVCSK